MRKRTRIGVVTAALLLGLVAPSVTGVARSDQVVVAGVTHGVDDLFAGFFRAFIQLIRRSPTEQVAQKVANQLDAKIPRFVRLPTGQVVELNPRHRWLLIYASCRASDVYQFQRQDEVNKQLRLIAAQVPGAIGFGATVHNLAQELAEAKTFGSQTRKAGAALLCMTADGAVNRAR